jgi:hypothetical protein
MQTGVNWEAAINQLPTSRTVRCHQNGKSLSFRCNICIGFFHVVTMHSVHSFGCLAPEINMSEKSTAFAGQVEKVVRQFEAALAEMNQLSRRDAKRMRDETGGVYSVQSLTIFMGPMRLLLDPIGYDVPDCDGAIDLYLLPPYDPVATLYLEHGAWFIHSADPTAPESISRPTEWGRSVLTRESIITLLESIAKDAVPSV